MTAPLALGTVLGVKHLEVNALHKAVPLTIAGHTWLPANHQPLKHGQSRPCTQSHKHRKLTLPGAAAEGCWDWWDEQLSCPSGGPALRCTSNGRIKLQWPPALNCLKIHSLLTACPFLLTSPLLPNGFLGSPPKETAHSEIVGSGWGAVEDPQLRRYSSSLCCMTESPPGSAAYLLSEASYFPSEPPPLSSLHNAFPTSPGCCLAPVTWCVKSLGELY